MNRPSTLGWALWLAGWLVASTPTGVAADVSAESGPAVETRRIDLSGLGPEAPMAWDFRCLGDGRRCVPNDAEPDEGWTTIPVPSQWQQQGFGAYSYGHDEDKPETVGEYRRSLTVPPSWSGGRIELVFEGVMTDTEVAIDGEPVGTPHRGGFYRFLVDLTDRVTPGREHRLEVRVAEASADRSVEKAERDADYWVFGGIYRPVWLRWRPAESIDHVAIDARHDGRFRALVRPHGITAASTVRVTVETADGRPVGTATAPVAAATRDSVEVTARFDGVEAWSAEAPHRHTARFELLRGDTLLHRVDQRFGFRTVELRNDADGRGLYVNGRRTLLRGINRHAFWPTTGRAISDAMDRADAERLKAMNLNAVRASHYPPDRSFLDACDELGLYVIDELAGWHDAYSTRAGRPLVRSMVERDVNHPSIVMWANGNEDGWNTDLDDDFAVHDPQTRAVLHTRSTFRGVDADHYADWEELDLRLDPTSWLNRRRQRFGLSDEPLPLFLPTEILHGLYDGGSGAGLERYWRRLRRHPRAMGLFLWVYSDEAIERTDRTPDDPDFLDTAGNYAPDGVLGPFREASANVRALQEVFAPIAIGPVDDPGGLGLAVANRFDHTTLDRVVVTWRWERLGPDGFDVLAEQRVTPPSVEPGGRWHHPIGEPPDGAEALRVSVHGPMPFRGLGDPPLVDQRTPLDSAWDAARRLADDRSSPDRVGLEVDTEAKTLSLTTVDQRLDLPLPIATGEASPRLVARRAIDRPGRRGVELQFDGRLQRLRVETFSNGWTRLAWILDEDRDEALPGIVFAIDETAVDQMRWLGRGPSRVWGNRQHGQWGLHGQRRVDAVDSRWGHEPQFRGYYAVRRAVFEGPDGVWTLQVEDPSLHLGLFAPRFPEDAEEATAPVHSPDGIALLHRLPVIGTKFAPGADLQPADPFAEVRGLHAGAIWIAPGDRLSP